MKRLTAIILITVFLLGTAIRIVPIETGERIWDESVYLHHAEIIAGNTSNTFNELDFRPPLLPVLIALVLALGGGQIESQLLIGIISGLSILVTYLLGKDIYSENTGLIASIAVATAPLAIHHSHNILVDSILPFIWALSAIFLYRGLKKDSVSFLGISGFLSGLAILTKFTSLLLPVLSISYILWNRWSQNNALTRIYTAIILGATSITVSPYLIWYGMQYGNPFGWFIQALQLSGATDPFLTYFWSAPYILLPVFLIGLCMIDFNDKSHFLPVLFSGTLIIALHLALGNKEPRFMLPILPFIAVVCGNGLASITAEKAQYFAALITIAVIPGIVFNPGLSNTMHPLTKGDITRETRTSLTPTTRWIREYKNQTTIYTNRDWPRLAYYTRNDIIVLDYGTPFTKHINQTMREDGIFYFTKNRPSSLKPTKNYLDRHPQFKRIVSFNQTSYLYQYTVARSQ